MKLAQHRMSTRGSTRGEFSLMFLLVMEDRENGSVGFCSVISFVVKSELHFFSHGDGRNFCAFRWTLDVFNQLFLACFHLDKVN